MNREKPNFGIALVFIVLLMLMSSFAFFYQDDNKITGNMVKVTGMASAEGMSKITGMAWYNPLSWFGGGSTASTTSSSGFSLFHPSTWFGGGSTASTTPATTSTSGFSLWHPSTWFGGGSTASTTPSTTSTNTGSTWYKPWTWFSGEDTATTTPSTTSTSLVNNPAPVSNPTTSYGDIDTTTPSSNSLNQPLSATGPASSIPTTPTPAPAQPTPADISVEKAPGGFSEPDLQTPEAPAAPQPNVPDISLVDNPAPVSNRQPSYDDIDTTPSTDVDYGPMADVTGPAKILPGGSPGGPSPKPQDQQTPKKIVSIPLDEDQQAISDIVYLASVQLLNTLLGDWAKEQITDYCKSEYNSSASASGNTSTTVLDEPLPEVNETNTTNMTNTTNYCAGYGNLTIGTVQYTVTEYENYYAYDYSWALLSCNPNITTLTYSVYMNPMAYPLANGELYYGNYTAANTSSFDSNSLYNETCIQTNDMSFGTNGTACFPPPNLPIVPQNITFNEQCEPLGITSLNNSIDIYLAANNYETLDEFSDDALNSSSLTASTSPFSSYYSSGQLNFYAITLLFDNAAGTAITNYALIYCNYTNPSTKFIIILNPDTIECTQTGYIVELNPFFTFKNGISSVSLTNVLNDFCSYVQIPNFMNPPTATILTQSMQTVTSQVSIQFSITDEEYPVTYGLLLNNVTALTSSVGNSSVKTHVLNIPPGTWNIQIKATDIRGNIGYSNVITMSTNNTITVDFSSLSPINIPQQSSMSIDLDSFANDPSNNPFTEWTHEPPFSDCFDFEPSDRILDGHVTLISKNISCQDTILFTVFGSSSRTAQGTIVIEVE